MVMTKSTCVKAAAVLSALLCTEVAGFAPIAPKAFSSKLSQSTQVAEVETTTVTPEAESTKVVEAEEKVESMIKPEKKDKIVTAPALWEYNFGLQDPKLPMPHGIVQGVTPPERYVVDESFIETLERDGVVHIKGVFDDEWVNYLRKATAYQIENPHFWAFAGTASQLYDYIQRNIWQTNKAFTSFYHHSAVGHVLAQCGRTEEVRVSTDLLMVNPNKGFKWHQDNQNGPILWNEALRFWITMDETPADHGAPVYLKGSHRNDVVSDQAVFVDIKEEGLEDYRSEKIEFRPKPGDMLVWHPRTIHKVDGPKSEIWTSYRRVLGGTVAKAGTMYRDKRGSGGVLSDLGKHGMVEGDKLESPYFPIIYPQFNPEEAKERDEGNVGRSPSDIVSKIGGLVSKASGEKFSSFFQVLNSRSED
mmetsp:Transcript_5560/g.8551  ORF Transcript_5560/g.8551 Transcript_5560/m.8551 type:complete len:418 (+) Transcript_5560:129-1382(+)